MKPICTVLLLLVVLFASGCCSIIHGTTQRVSLTSEPRDVKVEVAGQISTTPSYLILDRSKSNTIHFTKEGYESQDMPLKKDLDAGWYLVGNLVFGGIPGWVIDAITGAMWNIRPEDVYVKMVPKQ